MAALLALVLLRLRHGLRLWPSPHQMAKTNSRPRVLLRIRHDGLVGCLEATGTEYRQGQTTEIGKADQQHAEQEEQIDVMRVGTGQRAELEEGRHERPP